MYEKVNAAFEMSGQNEISSVIKGTLISVKDPQKLGTELCEVVHISGTGA